MSQGSSNGREPLLGDVIAIAVGILIISVAILRLEDPLKYQSDDPRAQPSVIVATTVIMFAIGGLAAAIGIVRLVRRIRQRS